MKETDLNSVSISNDRHLIAAGDNLGSTKIFLYPAHLQRQSYLSLDYGHQRGVKCVKFLHDDTFLITIGEDDNCIMLWAYKAYTLYRSSSQILSVNTANAGGLKDADVNDNLERLGHLRTTSGNKARKEDDEESMLNA